MSRLAFSIGKLSYFPFCRFRNFPVFLTFLHFFHTSIAFSSIVFRFLVSWNFFFRFRFLPHFSLTALPFLFLVLANASILHSINFKNKFTFYHFLYLIFFHLFIFFLKLIFSVCWYFFQIFFCLFHKNASFLSLFTIFRRISRLVDYALFYIWLFTFWISCFLLNSALNVFLFFRRSLLSFPPWYFSILYRCQL